MLCSHQRNSVSRIQAIIVLYKMHPQDSPSLSALQFACTTLPISASSLSILVADNSPASQPLPPAFTGTYLHDGQNPGLARRYNQALMEAIRTGATWLLLLDQDTQLNIAYVQELLSLAESLKSRSEIAIVVPKLIMNGRIMSPHTPRYRKEDVSINDAVYGLIQEPLRAFNSGTLVRVSALQAIGGFPEAYWLDYLDHATFHQIQQRGGKFFVMNSILEHELSNGIADRPQDGVRLKNCIAAEARFYSEYGSVSEYLENRLDLIRQVIGHGRRGRFNQAKIRLKVLLDL